MVQTICTRCACRYDYELGYESDESCPRCLWLVYKKRGDAQAELNSMHDLLGDSEEENHKLELEVKDLELDRKRLEEDNDALRATPPSGDTEVARLTNLLQERKYGNQERR